MEKGTVKNEKSFFHSPFLSLVNGHWSLADGKNPWLTGSYE